MGWLTKLQDEPEQKSHEFIPENAIWHPRLPRTVYGYRKDIGDGLNSNVVMSPVNWILRNFTEAELRMERRTGDRWEPMQDHDAVALIEQPNEFYDGDLLWKATELSYTLDGNAYWLKVRNEFGKPIQLWYLPHFLVDPQWPRDGSEFISHYDYRPEWGGPKLEVPVRDIVHFRFGLDPRNTRKGLSPLKPLLREVFTDEEASNFSASILRNMGVPGGIVAPKDASSLPKPSDVEEFKQYMSDSFKGDRRGEWLVMGSPTEIEQFGFDPNTLNLTNMRDIAEERVCAAVGIPAAVVGFGSGLQQTKVGATMRELRRMAFANRIEPDQRSMGKQLTGQLVPDFQSQLRRFRLRFDASMVPAFQEEETEKTRRITMMVEKGVLRVDKAQEKLGLEVDPNQAVYLRPQGSQAVDAETGEPVDLPNPFRNGGPPEGDDEEEEGAEQLLNRAQRLLEAANKGE